MLCACGAEPTLRSASVTLPPAAEPAREWLPTLELRSGQVVAEVSWGSDERLPLESLAAAVGPSGCVVVHEVEFETAVARAAEHDPEVESCPVGDVLRPASLPNLRRCSPHATLFVGGRNDAELPWDRFERIVVTDTLANIENPDRFLRSLRRALTVTGRILVLATDRNEVELAAQLAPSAGLRADINVVVRGFRYAAWLDPIPIPPSQPRGTQPRVIQLEQIAFPCATSGRYPHGLP